MHTNNGRLYFLYDESDDDDYDTPHPLYLEGHDAVFGGNITILEALSKNSGSFKIDHPLYPEEKYLSNSFVKSPDMMNIYNGNMTLDVCGETWGELPDYFEAINRDFRCQLTCIGGYAPVYIAEKINGNRFKIAGGEPGMEVS